MTHAGTATRLAQVGAIALLSVVALPTGAAFAGGALSGVGTTKNVSTDHPTGSTTRERGDLKKYEAGGNNVYVKLTNKGYLPKNGIVTAKSVGWNDHKYTGYSVTLRAPSASTSQLCEERRYLWDPCS